MAILAAEYVPRTFKVSDAFTVIFSRRKCHLYLIRVVAKNVRRIFNCVCCVYCTLILLSNQNRFFKIYCKVSYFYFTRWKVQFSKKENVKYRALSTVHNIIEIGKVNLTKNVLARFKKLVNDTLAWEVVVSMYTYYFCCVVSIRWRIKNGLSRITHQKPSCQKQTKIYFTA